MQLYQISLRVSLVVDFKHLEGKKRVSNRKYFPRKNSCGFRLKIDSSEKAMLVPRQLFGTSGHSSERDHSTPTIQPAHLTLGTETREETCSSEVGGQNGK